MSFDEITQFSMFSTYVLTMSTASLLMPSVFDSIARGSKKDDKASIAYVLPSYNVPYTNKHFKLKFNYCSCIQMTSVCYLFAQELKNS